MRLLLAFSSSCETPAEAGSITVATALSVEQGDERAGPCVVDGLGADRLGKEFPYLRELDQVVGEEQEQVLGQHGHRYGLASRTAAHAPRRPMRGPLRSSPCA